MSGKRNATFSVDSKVKMEFKVECVKNGNDMSEVVETFMTSYIRMSKKMRDEQGG